MKERATAPSLVALLAFLSGCPPVTGVETPTSPPVPSETTEEPETTPKDGKPSKADEGATVLTFENIGELPGDGYEWALGEGKTKLFGADWLLRVEDENREAIELNLECSKAQDELDLLADAVLDVDATLPTNLEYFRVRKQSTAFLVFVQDSRRIDAAAGGKFSRLEIGAAFENNKANVFLVAATQRRTVVTTPKLRKCIVNNLRAANSKGTFFIPGGALVGGIVGMQFDVRSTDLGANAEFADLVNAKLEVDLDKIKLYWAEYGQFEPALSANAILGHLQGEDPDPGQALGAVKNSLSGLSYIAWLPVEVEI